VILAALLLAASPLSSTWLDALAKAPHGNVRVQTRLVAIAKGLPALESATGDQKKILTGAALLYLAKTGIDRQDPVADAMAVSILQAGGRMNLPNRICSGMAELSARGSKTSVEDRLRLRKELYDAARAALVTP